MAKMRIHELAKELGAQSKDIVALLASLGVEGKTASSSIEEDQAEQVRAKLSGAGETKAPAKKSAKKAEEKPAGESAEDKPVKKSAAKAKEEAPAEAKKAPAKAAPAEAPAKEAAPAKAPAKAAPSEAGAAAPKPPVKKKRPNIILVSNPHNSQDRRGGYGGPRPAQSAPARPAGPARPQGRIVPNVKPMAPGESRLLQERAQEAASRQRAAENSHAESQTNVENNTPARQEAPETVQKPDAAGSADRSRTDGTGGAPKYRSEEGGRREGRPVVQTRGDRRPGRPVIQTQGDRRPGRPVIQTQGDRRGRNAGPARPGAPGAQRGAFGARPGYGAQGGTPDGKGSQGRRHDDKRSKEKTYQTEDGFRGGKGAKGKQIKQLERPGERKAEVKEEEKIKVITLPETLTIKELAEKMKIQPAVIIKKLFMQGKVVTVNQEVSYEQAEEIAVEFDILCEKEIVVDVIEELLMEEGEDEALMTKRPPVICVMGHVDHGKTSLLDAIRKTHVIDKEAGGITQAIGAYVVNTKGQKITFLDTPGHEAFTAMRMRGANSTDIAILVVAADDGVMPQTVEAINHAKAAGIEIVVAVNKIDKPGANIERVKQELSEYELVPEDWGGSTVFAPVSAKTGEGIDNLLDMILLTADILELKANAKRRARGIVIEAELDKGRGPVATVLVQKGTLHVGDFIAAGACHGKVRAMINDVGKRVKEAGPSTPVEILGLNDVPGAGEVFVSPENDKEARSFAETFISQNKVKLLDDTKSKMSLDDLFSQIQAGNLKELNIIIKADVQGSVEAVKESLLKLSNEEVVVKCIHSGVGAINESDVILASASSAIIIGFNVRPDATAKATAESEGVDIRLYDVIYKAIEDVEAAMKGLLDPIFEEKVIGHAEIRQIFKASGIGNIAGAYVLDGMFQRGCLVRISHEGEQIYEGKLASLKRFKDDVKEVKSGFECGLVFEDFQNFAELDIVEAYIMVEVPRT